MSNIKIVVFDFDDTLYSNIDNCYWNDYVRNGILSILKDIVSDDKVCEIEKILKNEDLSDRYAIELLKNFNKTEKDWFKFRKENYFMDKGFLTCDKIPNEEIKKFSEKFSLYIVTNSIPQDVIQNMDMLNMDKSLFTKILSNKFENGKVSKSVIYEEIIKKENILPHQMFVIGNDYEKDILPALQLGAKGKQVKDCFFTIDDFDELQ